MVLIIGNDHAVNLEIEEVNKIFCDYVNKYVVIEMKDKTLHTFKTSDTKRFFDYVCKAVKDEAAVDREYELRRVV